MSETHWLFIITKMFIVYLATQFTQSSSNKKTTLLKPYVNLVTFLFLLTLLHFLSYHLALCSNGYCYLMKNSHPLNEEKQLLLGILKWNRAKMAWWGMYQLKVHGIKTTGSYTEKALPEFFIINRMVLFLNLWFYLLGNLVCWFWLE